MREERIQILRDMVAMGYHHTEEQIQRDADWFTKEELLKWKENFINWKKANE